MFQRTTYFDARPILMLILIAVTAFAPAGALEVTAASKDATLTIGDNLILSWYDLDPDALYRIILTDEEGWIIADAQLKPKPDGSLGPVLVWSGTGVVGCDVVSLPNPSEYRFARLEEAEDMLKDRTFDLALLNVATQTSVARLPVRLDAAEQDVFFFSDEAGCPRCVYGNGEPVFLSGTRVVADSFWLYLVEAEQALEVGDPLDDVLDGPQEIEPPSSFFTEQVADELPPASGYLGVLQLDGDSEPPREQAFDDEIHAIVDPGWCSRFCDEGPVVVSYFRPRDGDKPDCL